MHIEIVRMSYKSIIFLKFNANVFGRVKKMNREKLKTYNKNRSIVQICYITNDYEETIKFFTEKLLIGPWTIMKHQSGTTKVKELFGKRLEEEFSFFCASAWVGEMEFEIIQPEKGPNPFSLFLEEKGPGIHHIKEKIADSDLLERCREYRRLGNSVSFHGEFQEDIFIYLDTMELSTHLK